MIEYRNLRVAVLGGGSVGSQVADQLLTLARSDATARARAPGDPFDLKRVAQDAAQAHVELLLGTALLKYCCHMASALVTTHALTLALTMLLLLIHPPPASCKHRLTSYPPRAVQSTP